MLLSAALEHDYDGFGGNGISWTSIVRHSLLSQMGFKLFDAVDMELVERSGSLGSFYDLYNPTGVYTGIS